MSSVLCIDMKSFFASCECVARGLDPLTTCLAVVSDTKRNGSVVLAASPMLKKKYGITTGNRLFDIPSLADILTVDARMGYYVRQSAEITRLLQRFIPPEAIHPYSIDESWVCLDGTERLLGDDWTAAQKIRQSILNDFGLHCCIGIGPNKFLAKVILDVEAKKTGMAECTYDMIAEKLWPQPVQQIWGIGKRMAVHLHHMGIRTLGDLASFPLAALEKKFGIMGRQLYFHAWGVDLSPVLEPPLADSPKSFGHSLTLLRDYTTLSEIQTVILELAEEVARRARKAARKGKTVTLAIQYSHHSTVKKSGFRHSLTIDQASHATMDIYHTALQLLKKFHCQGEPVRLVHLSLSHLTSDPSEQLNLFSDTDKQQKLGHVMDAIREKYGPTALLRASSYTPAGTWLERAGKIGGHRA